MQIIVNHWLDKFSLVEGEHEFFFLHNFRAVYRSVKLHCIISMLCMISFSSLLMQYLCLLYLFTLSTQNLNIWKYAHIFCILLIVVFLKAFISLKSLKLLIGNNHSFKIFCLCIMPSQQDFFFIKKMLHHSIVSSCALFTILLQKELQRLIYQIW